MTMFDGLTMVSYDGHNRNKMMVDHGLVVKCSQGPLTTQIAQLFPE